MRTPTVHELDYKDSNAVPVFRDAITKLKENNKFASSVYVYPDEDYAHMRLFLTEDGHAGFALKPDGDIVSVFAHKDVPEVAGAVHEMLEIAKQSGGTKMDCFDTVLPVIYSEHGFYAAARMGWNEDYKPDGWDYGTYKKYNDGRPDVVYMAYDPEQPIYSKDQGVKTDDYDEAVQIQRDGSVDRLGQSVTIRDNKESLEKYGLEPGKKYKVREVAAALEARQLKKYGGIALDDYSDDSSKKIARWMAEEVQFEMRHPEKSGVGWYSTKFQQALDVFGQFFPELRSDQNSRNILTALIAMCSDGQKVKENFAHAIDYYQHYRETGDFMSDRSHNRGNAIDANVQNYANLIKEMGVPKATKFLLQEKTVSELKRIAKAQGTEFTTDYLADTKLPMSAVTMGPKLGAFFANLMGKSGYLTMDRWWSRTFNRYRGNLLTAPTREGLDKFKAALGNPDMTDEEAMAATIPYRKSYESRRFKDGSDMEKSANTIWKAAFDSLRDAPENGSDREFMIRTVTNAQKLLRRRGINMTIADVQATLWYYEKRLYGELGARDSGTLSYVDAAQQVMHSHELATEEPADAEYLAQSAYHLGSGEDRYYEDNRGFVDFNGHKASINMLENADASTLVHELGHIYRRMMSYTAGQGDVAPEFKQSYMDICKWVGAKPGERWTVEQEEKFARGLETIIHEGRYLTPGLQRMAAWMKGVYGKLAYGNAPDQRVKFTKDARSFFDRLLIGDAAVQQHNDVLPAFKTPEEMGVSPKVFALYHKMAGDVITKAREEVEMKMIKQSQRQYTKWWNEEKASVRAEVAKAVDARPDVRAAEALKQGFLRVSAGEGEGGSIDLPMKLQAQEGIDPRSTSDRGSDPDTAAQMLGFGSGQELLQALASNPDRKALIEQGTDQEMARRHGDYLIDGRATDAAVAALHGDARGDLLHAEAQAFLKKAREIQPVVDQLQGEQKANLKDVDTLRKEQLANQAGEFKDQMNTERYAARQAVKDIPKLADVRAEAKAYVEGLPIRDLDPSGFLSASRKASRSAYELGLRNKFDLATNAKVEELQNHFRYIEATRVVVEAVEARDTLKGMMGKEVQSILGKADLANDSFREQMGNILRGIGLGDISRSASMRNQNISDWANEQLQKMNMPIIEPRVIEAMKKNWKDMNIDELRSVRDAALNIKQMADNEVSTILLGRKASFEEQVERAIGTDVERKFPMAKRTGGDEKPSGLFHIARSWDALNIKMQVIFDKLDKGDPLGPWRQNIIEPLRAATRAWHDLSAEINGKMREVLDSLPDKFKKSLDDKITLPSGEVITKSQAIGIALNFGNADNRRMIMNEGAGNFSSEDALHAVNQLSLEDMHVVQSMWDVIGSLRDRVWDLQKRMTGLEPDMVKPAEFDFKGETFQGGYYPLAADRRGVRQQSDPSALMEDGYALIGTPHGFTVSRSGAQYKLSLDWNQITSQHLNSVIKDLAFREALYNVNKFMSDPRIQQTVSETMGPEYAAQLHPWLRAIVNDQNGARSQGLQTINDWLNASRRNVATALVCYRATSLMKHLSNILRLVPYVDVMHMTQGLCKFVMNPKAAYEFVQASSDVMAHRRLNLDRDLRDQMTAMQGDDSLKARTAKVGFSLFGMCDSFVSVPGWLGAYYDNLAKYEGDHAKAVKAADRVIELALPSGEAMDQAAIQRNNPALKMLTMFAGQELSLYSTLRNLGANGNYFGLGAGLLVSTIAGGIMADALAGHLPGDDEDKGKWFARQALLQPIRTMPIISAIGEATVDNLIEGKQWDPRWSPLFDAATKIYKGGIASPIKFYKGDETTDQLVKDMGEGSAYAFGIPGALQAEKTGSYLYDVTQGNINPSGPFDFVWHAITGARK